MKKPSYFMFIDESGDASLNHSGQHFILATVIIKQQDFQIIEGYLRLLKRKFFDDDHKIIHATDLFERPYQKYRKLCRPRSVTGPFIQRLHDILETIPYNSCVYYVDKNKLRTHYGYKPAKGKKTGTINLDLPYELTATDAILDFTEFLKNKHSKGEIVIESRLHKDSNFVRYFDNTRKPTFPGGSPNPLFNDVRKSIPSLFISNKESGNSGLEIADMVAYITYRSLYGDPQKRMKLTVNNIQNLNAAIQKSAYKGTSPKLVHKITKFRV
jgi:hypothetical protein